MMNVFPRWQRLLFVAAIVAATPTLRALTVETYDGKTVTGPITGWETGSVLVETKTGAAPTKIPVPDVTAINISWQDRQAKPVSTTAPAAPPPPTTAVPATGPATQVAAPAKPAPKWRVEFGTTDHVTASLADWSDTRVTLNMDAPAASFSVPIEQLHAVWSSYAFQVKKAKDLKLAATAQDIAFVEKDGDVKPVSGLATGIETTEGADGGTFLKFKFEGEERKIKLDRLVGVLLAQRETPAEKNLFASFNLVNGDVLSAKIQSFADNVFHVAPLAGGDQAIDLPFANITKIEIHNGRLTSLTDLTPSTVSQVPYFDRLMPYQVNQSLTGGPLTLVDGAIAKGIAVHAKCTLTYDIDGGYERFKGKIGFQQPEGKVGRVAAKIVGDGKMLWQEEDLKGDAKPTALDIDVTGVKQLTLDVDYGKDQDVGDRVIWAEPRLIKSATH